MFQIPPISVIRSLHFLTTLGWLVTAEDGKPWNWCLVITGGHRCQGMLAGMSLPVTCAFGPNHSNILQLENSTLFLFHLLHGIPSVWTSLSGCHNLQGTIPSWLSLIPSQSMHISFLLSQWSLPLKWRLRINQENMYFRDLTTSTNTTSINPLYLVKMRIWVSWKV